MQNFLEMAVKFPGSCVTSSSMIRGETDSAQYDTGTAGRLTNRSIIHTAGSHII